MAETTDFIQQRHAWPQRDCLRCKGTGLHHDESDDERGGRVFCACHSLVTTGQVAAAIARRDAMSDPTAVDHERARAECSVCADIAEWPGCPQCNAVAKAFADQRDRDAVTADDHRCDYCKEDGPLPPEGKQTESNCQVGDRECEQAMRIAVAIRKANA